MKHAKRIVLGAVAVAAAAALLVLVPRMRAPAAEPWVWHLPAGFKEPIVPADNPMSEAKFQLGRRLFFDKRLSGNGTMGCGSCHLQRLAYTDGKGVATGSTGDQTSRGAQSIVNSAYYPVLTWSNPSQSTLEIQAAVPMFVENLAVELGITDENKEEVLARFERDGDYPKRFAEAFPGEEKPINFMNIIKAIATFERGVISADSRYDRAQAGKATLTESEERGRRLFFSEQAQCSTCHSGFNFSDQTMYVGMKRIDKPYHNTGLYNVDGKGSYPGDNPGVFGVLPVKEYTGAFRVPSLRNVALTAPYMHDGTMPTLEAVVDIYAAHGRNVTSGPNKGDGRRNPYKDPRIDKIRLNAQEKADIVAFLKTLTDESLFTDPRYSDPFATGAGAPTGASLERGPMAHSGG